MDCPHNNHVNHGLNPLRRQAHNTVFSLMDRTRVLRSTVLPGYAAARGDR